jgi:nitronate monooxygenase
VFTFTDLRIRILAAPMAGGPSTPALVRAAASVGAFGFLAAGSKSVEALAAEVDEALATVGGPFGVNLFVPPAVRADPAKVQAYRADLQEDAARYGVQLPERSGDSTDHWDEKIDYLLAHPVPVASFTFGTPPADVVERMHAVGTHVGVMVTDPDEAKAAEAVGADSLVVQGPDAGGHRGTHAVDKTPDTRDVDQLLADVQSVTALPLVAAGGISTAERVVELLARGAVAVQVGTALLLTPECGASAVHKEALRSRSYPGTTLTRAFSGRLARGLTNRFILDHDGTAPAAYPDVNQLTRPLRAAAAAAGDQGGVSLWAGAGFRDIREAPAAEIILGLWARG